jgi:hypothetical protein
MLRRILILQLFLVLFATGLKSAVYVVPDDSPTIQGIIDEASTGDTIYIRPGVYRENITINSKGLYISALSIDTSHVNKYETVIDGMRSGYVIWVQSCIDTVFLYGLTVCNGYGQHAGGIMCSQSLMVMKHMLIRDNSTWLSEAHGGGGITISESDVIMKDVVITNNMAWNFGGGIKLRYNATLQGENVIVSANVCSGGNHGKGGGISIDYNSSVYLYRSEITDNVAGIWGGGVALGGNGPSSLKLVNVTVNGNFALNGGGAIYACYEDNQVFMGNCILTNNLAYASYPQDQEVYFDDTGNNNRIAWCYSDIQGGRDNMYIPSHSTAYSLEGNIDLHPYFSAALALSDVSPCVDAGTDYYFYWGVEQFNLGPDQYSGAAPDMGAYENLDVTIGTPEAPEVPEEWITVYPNPAAERVNIGITGQGVRKVTISLYDISGALILEKRYNCNRSGGLLTLDLTGLAQGTYILRATAKGRETAVKVVH